MIRGLRSVIYATNDLPAAKAWYSQVLGQAPYFNEPFLCRLPGRWLS